MELNEIIAMSVCAFIILVLAVYESFMHRRAQMKIREARESAGYYAELYRATAIERDLLEHRVKSRDCQKVIAFETQLKDAEAKIKLLEADNETYRKQLERNKRRKAASGTANTESC